MTNQPFSEAKFEEILAQLEYQDRTAEQLRITPETRTLIQDGLERALVLPAAMQAYLRKLDAIPLPRPFRHDQLVPDDQAADILRIGLNCLSDRELASLVLNPLAMLDLRDQLEDSEIADYWWAVATRFDPEAAIVDRVLQSRAATLDELVSDGAVRHEATEMVGGDDTVAPKQTRNSANDVPNGAYAAALGNQPSPLDGRGREAAIEHWTVEHPLEEAELLSVFDTKRDGDIRTRSVIIDYKFYAERDAGTLDVVLSQPLPLVPSATCTAKLLDENGDVLRDEQDRELPTAVATANDGRLRFCGIAAHLSAVRHLEVDYDRPDRFHVRLRIPFQRRDASERTNMRKTSRPLTRLDQPKDDEKVMLGEPREHATPPLQYGLAHLFLAVAIIGMVIAVLPPAIQTAREAARRSQCAYNLKQIGLGLANYHDIHKSFPAGWNKQSPNGQPDWGWAVMILPFMEQATLYEELDPTERRLNQLYYASAPANLQQLLQTPIKTYRCPSDTLKELNTLIVFGSTDHFRIATSNYVANVGTGSQTGTAENNGVFFGNSWLGIKDILDGTSHTIAVGERSASHLAAQWAGVGGNNSIDNEHQPRATARGGFVINFDYTGSGAPQNQSKGYASYHPGGTQFVMCDGAVRFVSQNTNSTLVQRMAIRNDGEPIALP